MPTVRFDRTPIVFHRNKNTITAFPCNPEHSALFRAGELVMCAECRITVEEADK